MNKICSAGRLRLWQAGRFRMVCMQGHAGRPTGWLCRKGPAGRHVGVVVVRKANLLVCRHRLCPKPQRSQVMQAACRQAVVVAGRKIIGWCACRGHAGGPTGMALQAGAGRLSV